MNPDIVCFLIEFISYSNQLNSIENSLNIFQFENMDLNKFWLKYFGVVNLSDHNYSFLELSVLGKGLKFCLTPPKYCHGKLKESTDKFFWSASLKAYFEPHGPEESESILETSFLSENDAEPEIFEHKDKASIHIQSPNAKQFRICLQCLNRQEFFLTVQN